jgi:4-hydroxybenzoyl-CoA thioesterase
MAFRFRHVVRFDDVDHAGIVYFPRYFHYFHIAFEEIFRARLGAAGLRELIGHARIGLPAVHAEADFRRPLAFGDEVELAVELIELGERSLTLGYRAEHPERTGHVYAEGRVTAAVIDLDTFRPVPIPAQVREIFEDL